MLHGVRNERSLGDVSRLTWCLLALALAAQIGLRSSAPAVETRTEDLPRPPGPEAVRLGTLGEVPLASRLMMLYLQSFDLRGGNVVPYQNLDYAQILEWLGRAAELDTFSEYPLFLAARIYGEVPDPQKMRRMLDFTHRMFLKDPNRGWPYLAHACLLAKHRLRDMQTARRYAADLARLADAPNLPAWARSFEAFILEDMGELEQARIVLGGVIASGRIRDPEELRYLQLRLRELEHKGVR